MVGRVILRIRVNVGRGVAIVPPWVVPVRWPIPERTPAPAEPPAQAKPPAAAAPAKARISATKAESPVPTRVGESQATAIENGALRGAWVRGQRRSSRAAGVSKGVPLPVGNSRVGRRHSTADLPAAVPLPDLPAMLALLPEPNECQPGEASREPPRPSQDQGLASPELRPDGAAPRLFP